MGSVLREIGDWARRRKVFAALVVSLALGVGILIGSVISGRVAAHSSTAASDAALLPVPSPVNLSSAFAGIVANVEPAVVNIRTTQILPQQANPHGLPDDPFGGFLHHFFNNPNQTDAETSLGSGVIVDPKGYILTNEHVVAGGTKIEVKLGGDVHNYAARLVGEDSETDLAVVKIDAGRPLPVAHLGDSQSVKVGDWVLAFGEPFGLQSTVTAGIVSAQDRSGLDVSQQQLQHFIQTDAAINRGNSGGPLVNMAGQVIGINTAIYTDGRDFEGVGFALPSNMAIDVYNQIVSKGHVTRGSIGVLFQDQQSEDPLTLKLLGAPYGVILQWVDPASPAARAGIRAGDVVTSVNGRPVHRGDELVDPILRTPIGQKVEVGYLRNGVRHEVPVVVADRDKLFPTQAAEDAPSPQPASALASRINHDLGLTVATLTPDLAQRLGMEGLTRGAIVRVVEPTSFAWDAGFKQEDVIVEMNHAPVYTAEDFELELGKLRPGQDILFRVLRRQQIRGEEAGNVTVYLAGVDPGGR